MDLTDFILGVLVANALAHLIIGLTKIRFLGLFGYSPAGNIAYGILQFIVALILAFVKYGFEAILNNGLLLGTLTVLVVYLLLGKFLVRLFSESVEKTKNQ